jgi:hypothetical protein
LNAAGKGVRKIAQVVEAQGKPKAIAATPEGIMLDVAEVVETEANPLAEVAKLQEGPAVEGKAAAQGARAAEDAEALAAKAEDAAKRLQEAERIPAAVEKPKPVTEGVPGEPVQERMPAAGDRVQQIVEQGPAHEVPAVEGAAIEGPYSGALCKDPNPRPDIGAEKLAAKLNGQSRVYFSNDPIKKEFDVISNEFIAEAKPAMQSIKPEFRQQAKRAFEAARQTGRKVYFHFNGEPCRDIIRKLQEYQRRYGVEMVIDTEVLY